jgi:hypothetical protein
MTTRTEYDADFETLGGDTINALEKPEEATRVTAAVLAADTVESMPHIPQPPDNRVTLAYGVRRDGEWLREAEVRELNGLDEEELARVGTDWPRFITTLVQRGTVSLGGEPMTPKMAAGLLIGDRELLILAIRRVTFGGEIEISGYECPYCGESTELTIHLDSIPRRDLPPSESGEYSVELRDGRSAIVHLPTAADQDHVLARAATMTPAQQNTEMLFRCLLGIRAHSGDLLEVTSEGVRALGWADRRNVLRFLSDSQPGPRYDEVSFTHESCGREVPLPLSVASLFLAA